LRIRCRPIPRAQGGVEVNHQRLEPAGGRGPLRLLGRELVGRAADLLDRGAHLIGGRLLLLCGQDRLLQHGRRRRHQVTDLAGLAGAVLGRHDRGVRLVLHPGDDLADRVAGLHRPLGQLAHLGRDHGKALAGLAGPRRLDRRVQREQVRLRRDLLDQLEDLADLLRPLAEGQRPLGDRLDLFLHVVHGVAGPLGGLGHRV
jgi:hypothetical protein